MKGHCARNIQNDARKPKELAVSSFVLPSNGIDYYNHSITDSDQVHRMTGYKDTFSAFNCSGGAYLYHTNHSQHALI